MAQPLLQRFWSLRNMKKLGALRMRKHLASETSADIWLAYDRDIDRDCLVRVYRAEDNADDKAIEREQQAFLTQARALAGARRSAWPRRDRSAKSLAKGPP